LGTGRVLVIWSVLIVAIGVILFLYGIAVVIRDRRRGRRAKAARQVVRAQLVDRVNGRVPMPRVPRALPAAPPPPRALPMTPLALPAGPSTAGPPAAGPPPGMPGSPVSARVPAQRAPEMRFAVDAGPPDVSTKAPANASPRNVRPAGRPGPGGKAKRDCGELRERCEQLRRHATNRGAAAARTALAAERAHEDLRRARRAREEAQDARNSATAKASELSHAVAEEAQRLAEHRVEVDPAVERMTTHAAFAAYRRGDITADQLREVFRKAEGWTPQQDQLTHSAAQTRAEETDAQRALDAALAAEQVAEEEMHRAVALAQTADDEAREAAAEARAACAAAVDCEQGHRGRR
jgi:hypothetical protein